MHIYIHIYIHIHTHIHTHSDINKSGFITVDELAKYFERTGLVMTREEVQAKFE